MASRLELYIGELMKYCKALDLITPGEIRIEYKFLRAKDKVTFLEDKIKGYKNVRTSN